MTEHTIIIGFAVFCLACEKPIRSATDDDYTGQVNFCPNCNDEMEMACGITISASHGEDLQWTYGQMKKHMNLVHKILMMRFNSLDDE